MLSIHIIGLFMLLAFSVTSHFISKDKINLSSRLLILLFGVALLYRMLLAYTSLGYVTDTVCFASWADRIYEVGLGNFYSPDVFTDYPPGYMYILYIIGALRSILGITYLSGPHLLLLKLPSIICDMACGYIIYKEAKKLFSQSKALTISLLYLFNPVIIFNSSAWGQVDSIYTLGIVLLCLFLSKGKLSAAYITFGLGILLKPQTLIFAPLLLVGMLDHIFLQNFNFKKLAYNLVTGLSVIIGMLLLCLPFGLDKIVPQYTSTISSYPYATVNAYNFWAFLGLNWVSQDNSLLFLSYRTWGTIVILLIIVFTFIFSLRMKKNPHKYPILGAFIILTMFVFSVRMHERYMYAGLILLLLAYLYRPGKSLFASYSIFSILHWYNTAHIYFFYGTEEYDRFSPIITIISAGMIFALIHFCYTLVTDYIIKDEEKENINKLLQTPSAKATRLDWVLLIAITLIYSAFALYDLGNQHAPTTTYDMVQGDSLTFSFEEGQEPSYIYYYIAPINERTFNLEIKTLDTNDWQEFEPLLMDRVFTWTEADVGKYVLETTGIRDLRLSLMDDNASIIELAFSKADGTVVQPINTNDYPTLFDEAYMLPERKSFRNSMYFDEIYFGRTAYEFIHGLPTYENTHPPLGKIFIALGVAICGMNPFGWRITGTLFGIAMLPFVYLFAKRITKNTPVAAVACFIYAFDFMHFVQTRIATIDVYVVFFIIVMYFFMHQYCTMSFYEVSLKRTLLPLGACGIAMGLGVACKWTGAYAGIGLAVLFFITLYKRYKEYRFAKEQPHEYTNGISNEAIIQKFVPYTKKTILFCIVFFVIVPLAIYILSYIPFVDHHNPDAGFFEKVIQNQIGMFNYHSTLDATHPFQSYWLEWPTIACPIWYYSSIISDSVREGISSFGNPFVWWVGIIAFLHMLILALLKEDKTARFLLIGFFAQFLPWAFVTRITFIYHYFPSVIFVVLMIAHSLMKLKERYSTKKFMLILVLYASAVFFLFLLFYPVLAGQPVYYDYVVKNLRWSISWVLVADILF